MAAVTSIPSVKLSSFETNNDTLTFCIENMNVSLVNAIRRTVLSEIPCVVFRTMPYEKSNVIITKNTSRLNNEILKQRISCIPIHITDLTLPIDKYVVELDVTNDTNSMMYVTTQNFKIKDIETGKYLVEREVNRIFPANEITKEHVLITRLRPRINDDIPGESISLTAKFAISNAKEDSGFNVVSTCSYSFTPDKVKVMSAWSEKEKVLRSDGMDDDMISFEKDNWMLQEAKRIYKPNAFDFIIESIGIYDNKAILSDACDIMVNKLNKIVDDCESQKLEIIESDTLMKAFDIKLENEDYSLGKSIEYALHEIYYKQQQVFDFVGFRKNHPHDSYSIIRVSFKDDITDKMAIFNIIKEASLRVIESFNSFKSQL